MVALRTQDGWSEWPFRHHPNPAFLLPAAFLTLPHMQDMQHIELIPPCYQGFSPRLLEGAPAPLLNVLCTQQPSLPWFSVLSKLVHRAAAGLVRIVHCSSFDRAMPGWLPVFTRFLFVSCFLCGAQLLRKASPADIPSPRPAQPSCLFRADWHTHLR